MTLTSGELRRACPACGNSQAGLTQVIFRIPEFDVLRCGRCTVTFINLPITNQLGFEAQYGLGTDSLLSDKARGDFRMVRSFLKGAGAAKSNGIRLLDIGCGIGTFLLYPRREGWKVSGLEMNPGAVRYAQDTRGLDVSCGSVEQETAFPAESFDIVTMFGVIEHLSDPAAAIKECSRLLADGGFLILQTPAGDGTIRRAGLLLYRVTGGQLRFQVREFYQTDGGHSIIFNRRSIELMLSHCGLKVISLRPSTYGLRILLKRFEGASLPGKLVKSAGTTALFLLGRALRANNHMTVVAQKSTEMA